MSTSTVQLPTGTWSIDPAASTATVSVKNFGFKTVPAELAVVGGSVEIGADNTVSSATVSLSSSSFSTGNPKRDEHVHSADFLDAENHPNMTFQARSVVPVEGGFTATGQVAVKGKTTPVEVSITDVSVNGTSATFSVSATLDRNELGIDKMPSLMIGRALQFTASVTATAN